METLDVLLGVSEQQRLRVIVQVYMDAAPDWMGRESPDAHMVAINGQPLRREAAPGYWPNRARVREAGRFAWGAPGAVQSRYGKGTTLVPGSFLAGACEQKPDPALEPRPAALLDWTGTERAAGVQGSAVEVRPLESGRDRIAGMSHHPQAMAEAEVRLVLGGGDRQATDLETGERFNREREGSNVKLKKVLARERPGSCASHRQRAR